jgi:hypothetical protein
MLPGDDDAGVMLSYLHCPNVTANTTYYIAFDNKWNALV